jgi:hypothetical protein
MIRGNAGRNVKSATLSAGAEAAEQWVGFLRGWKLRRAADAIQHASLPNPSISF